ncbi:MAG: hypothetical protein RL130_632 [Actinomycetota bacterium]
MHDWSSFINSLTTFVSKNPSFCKGMYDNLCRMKSPLKILATFALALLTVGITASYAADIEDEQWVASPELRKLKLIEDAPHSFIMEEVASENAVVSYLFAEYFGASDKDFERYICTSTKTGKCANPQKYVFNSVLPTCASDADVNCVASLVATGTDGTALQASFSEYAVPDHFNNYSADSTLGIPAGVTAGIWTIPGAPHKFGNQYAVIVNASGQVQSNASSGWPLAYDALSARIVPVSIQKTEKRTQGWGTFQDNLLRPDTKANTRGGPFYDNNEGFRCISPYGSNNDQCLIAHAFPENIRFKLKIQLPMAPIGWLHGRMIEPVIDIAKEASHYTVTVDANPARIPTVFHTSPWSKLPANVQAAWDTIDKDCMLNSCGYRSANNYSLPISQQSTQLTANNFGSQAINLLKLYLPLVNDTAIVSPSTWSWRTLPSSELKAANGCFTAGEGVKGVVTTNASAYSAGPPSFVDGTLNYRVAAPHFNRDGTVFKGDYTLVLDSKVARCLYKFSSAPIQATISVVNDKGEQSVATTTVTEKNGWLRLVARNFEFSSPSISVKLTQDASAQEAKTTTPVKKSTITCMKGKTTKKVTSVNPKCPSGYKKK